MAIDPLIPYVPTIVRGWPSDTPTRLVTGTLVSADISGFTALSEKLASLGRRGAEELTTLLNQCFTGMIDVAHGLGGDVLAFGGDALLILFRGEAHTARAVQAAVGMRGVVEQPVTSPVAGRVELGISIGAHAGAFALMLVPATFDALVVVGAAASDCVRAEGAAPKGGILLSGAAAGHVDETWLADGVDEMPGSRLLAAVPPEVPHDPAPPPEPRDLADCLPPALVEQVRAGPVHGEHRRVAIGFVEFQGTDGFVREEGPESLQELLAVVGEALAEACEVTGAHVLATDLYPDGGKFIVAAGAPTSAGDDPAALLRTLRHVIDNDPGLSLRAGANHGPVYLGALGSPTRRALTVMGDAVNLSARLMQAAGHGQLVASATMLERSRTLFDLEHLPPFHVKGKELPIHASVVGAVRDEEVLDVAATPLVGRGEMLAVLDQSIRYDGVVAVVGPMGIGRSRLVTEIVVARDDAALVVRVDRYQSTVPHSTVRRILHELLGLRGRNDPDEVGRVLTTRVVADAPELVPWLPLLAVPAGATVEPTPEASALDARFRRDRMEAVTSDLVMALAPDRLLVVDDLDQADDASIRLLRTLGEQLVQARHERRDHLPVLVTVAEVVEEGQPGAVLALPPLADADVHALALELAGDLADRDLDRIVTASQGSPLFTIELAGAAARGEELPDTVEDVVTAHIDRLSAADRALVRELAVVGETSSRELIAHLLGADEARPERWAGLHDLVEHDGSTLRFRHPIHQQVAYFGLAYHRRQELHAEIGALLEAEGAPPSTLSLHYFHGGIHDRAWELARTAAVQATDDDAPSEATDLWLRALHAAEHLDLPDPEIAAASESLGDVAELAARFDDAVEAYATARTRTEVALDDSRMLRKLGTLRVRRGEYDEARHSYDRAAARLEPDAPGTTAELAELLSAAAGVTFRRGDYLLAATIADDAAHVAEAAGDLGALAHSLYLADHAAYLGGQGGDGARTRRALEVYAELGDDVGEANVRNNMGVRAFYEGRWDDAVAAYRLSRAARERAGDVVGAATQINNIAEILADQGHLEEAIDDFEQTRRVWSAAGFRVGVALATSNLGWARTRAGEHDAGAALLEQAVRLFEAIGADGMTADTSVRLAAARLRQGRPDDAADLARPHTAGMSTTALMARRVLARTLPDPAESRAALDEVLRDAREIDATFEVGMTLLAIAADTPDGDDASMADAVATLARLGIHDEAIHAHR